MRFAKQGGRSLINMGVGQIPDQEPFLEHYRPSYGLTVCFKYLARRCAPRVFLSDFDMPKCCLCAASSHHDQRAVDFWCWGEDAALSVSRGKPAISPKMFLSIMVGVTG